MSTAQARPPATIVATPAGRSYRPAGAEPDPITTELLRQGLIAAAEQMKQALVRTSFSPIIYEVFDFACALYDTEYRLLSQALGLQHFMGRLSFAVERAVAAVGGEQALDPGDILLYNIPYGTGAHSQDAAIVMPVFLDAHVVGYSAIKAHWMDLGGKDPYCTDTVDLFQEGTVFPGVKLCRRGELVDDIVRTIGANSRVPALVLGDMHAEIVGVRTGAAAMIALIERYGEQRFWTTVSHMFAHGETMVRSYFETIPDGTYSAWGEMDDNGVDTDRIPFEVTITVAGSDVTVDFSHAPDVQNGPTNSPLPATIAATRIAVMMLAGGAEPPNEGHFVPVTVVTREDSMFHPRPPAPCFLYGWPAIQAIEVIFRALSVARRDGVPAGSGGCINTLVWWGQRVGSGESWADGAPFPIGLGAHSGADGASALMHISQSAARSAPAEVFEARFPLRVESADFAADSCGAGEQRGGLGLDIAIRALEPAWLTTVVERTANRPWGLHGARPARPNAVELQLPDGTTRPLGKSTRVEVPAGSILLLRTGGGGGFGDPARRDPEAVRRDLREGYITAAYAGEHHPQVVDGRE